MAKFEEEDTTKSLNHNWIEDKQLKKAKGTSAAHGPVQWHSYTAIKMEKHSLAGEWQRQRVMGGMNGNGSARQNLAKT